MRFQVIVIDPFTYTIKEAAMESRGGGREIYRMLSNEEFYVDYYIPRELEVPALNRSYGDHIYIDGNKQASSNLFRFEGHDLYAGKGVVLHVDRDGNYGPPKISLESVTKLVTFITRVDDFYIDRPMIETVA